MHTLVSREKAVVCAYLGKAVVCAYLGEQGEGCDVCIPW